MSPRQHRRSISQAAGKALTRMGASAGQLVREERLRRRWTLRLLADRAGVSAAQVQQLETGTSFSLETFARVTTALDLRPELIAPDPRRRLAGPGRDQDLVHAAMGELEVGRLRGHGFQVAIDEPYQHYQFAGRADVVAWDLAGLALLHIENRTRFPDIQDALGSYAAKRSYLGRVLAERLSIPGGRWRSESHVIAALWSAEVLHVLRLRIETFKAACPDPAASVRAAWWAGMPPEGGKTSSLLLIDPAPGISEARRFAELDDLPRIRSRYHGYADAAARLR